MVEFVPGSDLLVAIAPGADRAAPTTWPWTDITDDVRVAAGISLEVGRRDEASKVDAGKCSLTLDNTGGHYCRTNPTGRWYGLLGKNTPLRVRVKGPTPQVTDSFTRSVTDGWGSSTGGGAWTNAFSSGSAADFDVNGTQGLHAVQTSGGFRLSYLDDVVYDDVDVTVEVSVALPTGAALEPTVLLRGLDVNTYYMARASIATSGAITLQLRRNLAGDTLLTSAATGVTHAAGTPLKIRAQALGDTIRARVWQGATEPTVWHATVADTGITAAGWVGVRSGASAGNTNAKPVIFTFDNFAATAWVDRFSGDVPEWPPRWDKSRAVKDVPITAAGVIRRLSQGKAPPRSVLERAVISGNPAAYWTLGDGENSTQAANGLAAGQPLVQQGLPVYNVFDPPVGAPGEKFPQILGATDYAGGWTVTFDAPVGDATGWAIDLWVHALAFGADAQTVVAHWRTTGTYGAVRWVLYLTRVASNDTIHLLVDHGGGATVTLVDLDDAAYGNWHHIRVKASQDTGTQVTTSLFVSGVEFDTDTASTFTVGQITSFTIGDYAAQVGDLPLQTTDGLAVAYAAVYGHDTPGLDWLADGGVYDAGSIGLRGEQATARIARVCGEENLTGPAPFPGLNEFVGAQPTAAPLEIFRDAEVADQGLLYERGVGFDYQRRAARYNAPVAMTLNCDTGDVSEPPEPTDDDQQLRNDVLVKRATGSSARWEATGDQAPAIVGRYDDEVTANIYRDTVLAFHAQWRVWLGTQTDLRWPLIMMDLYARPALVTPWLSAGIGSRIQVTDPPAEVGPDDLDLFVEGYSELLGWREWTVGLNCSPARPYVVAVVEGAGAPAAPPWRVESGSGELQSSATTTATTMWVDFTGMEAWTTTADAPADFPFDIDVGGEQVTVSAISGTTSPQQFTVVRSVNGVVKSHPIDTPVRLWRPPVIAL